MNKDEWNLFWWELWVFFKGAMRIVAIFLVLWALFWVYGQWAAQKRMIERGQEVSVAGEPAHERRVT